VKEKKLAGLSAFERFQSLAKALVAVPKVEIEAKRQPQAKTPRAKRENKSRR
jgi:hypothetical protein